MSDQTLQDDYIFGEGMAMEVSLDNESSWTNVGVFEAGVTATHNYDKVVLEPGNKGKTCTRSKNETVAIAPSPILTWNLQNVSKLTGGMFTYSAVAGTPVAGATQTASSGSWAYNKFILIENQNYNVTAITVNSVTGGTDGLLTVDVDYYVGQNSKGQYGVFIIDSVNVTTTAQDMVIDYDYTPSTGKVITAGTTSVVLSRFIVRLRHYTNAALTTWDVEFKVFGVDMDSGLAFDFKPVTDDGSDTITVALTGNIDTNQTSGAQLLRLEVKDSALVSC
jgi:hypothetical protein